MHAPTNVWKACLLYFVLERYDRYNDPKNTKATITRLKKREACHSCAHAVQLRRNYFRSKLAKNERGIAVLPRATIVNLYFEVLASRTYRTGTAFWLCILGWESGSATDIDRLLVSSGLSAIQKKHLIKNDESCRNDFKPNCRQNWYFWVLCGISARSGRILNVWTCMYTAMTLRIYQVYPFLGWRSSYIYQYDIHRKQCET